MLASLTKWCAWINGSDGNLARPGFSCSSVGLLNLIENASRVEVFLLRLLPAAKYLIHREDLHFRKSGGILVGDALQTWPVKVFRGYFLAFGSIQKAQISFRHFACAVPIHHAVYPGDRRLRQDG